MKESIFKKRINLYLDLTATFYVKSDTLNGTSFLKDVYDALNEFKDFKPYYFFNENTSFKTCGILKGVPDNRF